LKILNASIDLPSTSEIRYNSKNKSREGKKEGGDIWIYFILQFNIFNQIKFNQNQIRM
jgi:hypothetical protein